MNDQPIAECAPQSEVADRTAGRRDIIRVDGSIYPFHGDEINGREVLETAGKHPVGEFIVYWIGKDRVLEDLNLDEAVHLHRNQVEEFLTFRNDRSFRFELEGRRQDWGAPCINEETLRKLAGVGAEFRVWLERKDQPDRVIAPGEMVKLDEPGIERFYIEKAVTITVVNEDNGKDFPLHGFKDTKLATLFAEMYVKLGLEHKDDDRLRCEETGADVFQFRSLTLGQYLEAGHCKCLVWLFAGGTGGASCR